MYKIKINILLNANKRVEKENLHWVIFLNIKKTFDDYVCPSTHFANYFKTNHFTNAFQNKTQFLKTKTKIKTKKKL